jgi:hypothetical protein
MLSYWTPYDPEHLLEHIERLEPQVLQIGHFGPLFYSMAHTESWAYFGMPVAGIDEGIAWWREFVASVQQLGISVVGLMSLGFFFGDHDESGKGGFFKFWYNACLNNPNWIEAVKRMTTQAIEVIGLDGVNSLYNYVGGCCCEYCQEGLRGHLRERYGRFELVAMGIDDIDTHVFERIPNYCQSGEPSRLELECVKFAGLSLKSTYDEIFIEHGRGWSTILHAFTAGSQQKLVVHLVNFGNDESSQEYRPLATEPAQIDLRLPSGAAVQRIYSTSPDGSDDEDLDFRAGESGRVRFRVPPVEVYGVAVIELAG